MAPRRRIHVQLADATVDLSFAIELLDRNYDGAYRVTLTQEGARGEFLSMGGPQPAFTVTGTPPSIAIDIDSVDRDYCAAATVAEQLARRHRGHAVDGTTGDRLWPPIDGGDTHPTIARVRLGFEIDPADGERLIPTFLELAQRLWPAALPRCFSDREPFLCETPRDLQAFLALCQRQAGEGASVCWLATLPALDGYCTWPRRAQDLLAQIRLDIGVAAEALDEARPFAAELARAVRATSSTIAESGALQLRLGTSFIERPRGP